MKLKILTVPHPLLHQKSKKISQVDSKIKKFITNLETTLAQKKDPPGVGLSAPQVGKLYRVFSTFLPPENANDRNDLTGKKFVPKTYINPRIIKASKKLTLGPNPQKPILEGCLSIPKIYGPVKRHQWIKLRWQTANSKWQIDKFSEFTARVIQHEIDHLNGTLFTDRALEHKLPIYEEVNGKLTQVDFK